MDNLTVAMTRDYVEILEILKLIPKEERNKIPDEEIAFFEKHKDLTYKFKLDSNKDLSEQNVSRGAYALFVDLYQKYIATQEERQLIDNILDLNEKNAVALKSQEAQQQTNPKLEQDLVVKKEKSFFRRCLNRIKAFFKFKGEQ